MFTFFMEALWSLYSAATSLSMQFSLIQTCYNILWHDQLLMFQKEAQMQTDMLSLHSDPPEDTPAHALNSTFHQSLSFRSNSTVPPRAPLASQEADEMSTSDISSRVDLNETIPKVLLSDNVPGACGGHPKEPQEVQEDSRYDDAVPELPLGFRHWQSVPCLHATAEARRSMEIHELTSLQNQMHYDSGVSGFSGMTRSMSDMSRRSSSSTLTTDHDITIMHTLEDTEMAKKFKKKVKNACSKRMVNIKLWDETCTGGVSAKKAKDELLNDPAILFFIVTNNFLDGYHTTPYSTLTGVMYEVLQGALHSPRHLVVPVKPRKEEPTEVKVGQVFPYLKCLKLDDSNSSLKKEIKKSVDEGGVAKKKKWYRSITSITLELAPDTTSFATPF